MDISAELHRFDPDVPIEEAWFPPSSWYTHPDVHALERGAVLANSWQPVCRVAQVAQPGDYVAGCFVGEPYVVVRGQDGAVAAYANVCRHKGREVVVGQGHAQQLVCGYHAWAYGLDGRLTSAPQVAGIRNFDRAEMSLRPLPCHVWGPWVMVAMNGSPEPMPQSCPELDKALEASGWANLRYHARSEWEIACNWKVYVDNYLDGGYHIPHMHPSLNRQLDMDTYQTQLFARSSIQSSQPGEGLASDAGNRRIGGGAFYAWTHPNFMLNRYGPCLDSNWVIPMGPDRCRVVYEFFFDETIQDAQSFVEASIEESAVIQREDIDICQSVQVGLGSSHYDRGRYAPRLESGEYHFHRLLAQQLQAAAARPAPALRDATAQRAP